MEEMYEEESLSLIVVDDKKQGGEDREKRVHMYLPFFAGVLLVVVEVCGNVDTDEFVGVSNEFVLVGEDDEFKT